MSLEGKTLKVCNCNRTMPLDAKALAAALKSGAPLDRAHELCRKDVAAFQAALGGGDDVLVACTQEAPLFAELHRRRSARRDQLRQHPRDRAAGRPRQSRHAEDRRAARAGGAARARAGARGRVQVRGPGADRRPGGGGARLGRAPRRAARRERARSPSARRASCRSSGAIPVWSGKRDRADRLARRLRGRVGAGEPDRPRRVHALQRLRARLPRARDRLQLPDRPRASASRTAQCVTACGAIGAIDFRARETRAQGALRPRARPVARAAASRMHAAAAGLFRAGRRSARAGARRARARARWSASSRSRGSSQYNERICAHSRSGKHRLHAVHRRLLDRRDPAPTATASRSSRTCAWAAAAARPSARRAR